MKVCHPFICLLFLTGLQDGGLGPVKAETYTVLEGRNITVSCSFYLTGGKMYFCMKDCSRENILVETTDYRAQRGRYSIEFNKIGTASYFVLVSITELKRSDSGWYRCALGQTWIRHTDFEIVVNYDSPAATPTSTQSLSFSPVSSSSSETTKQSKRSAPPPDVLLSVAVVLVITVILLAAAFLVFFKHRSSSQHEALSAEPSVETGYATVIKTHRVKKEIREDGENRTSDKTTRTTAEYSLSSWPQNRVEEDIVDYSTVFFSKHTTIVDSSAPCDHRADSTLYSEPWRDGNPATCRKHDSPPLYSTITLH
ncbi:hypothetical protein CRENBAI_018991 [Crenichthys baileyi]|uniref:Immunoglobulin domain-containing protein n=1 Tax=Crenichthys baileyi TaxID=28760 RepID=A0AAV9RLA9_9TELE